MKIFVDATGLTEPITGLTNYSVRLLQEILTLNESYTFTVLCSQTVSSTLIDFLINDESVTVLYTSIPNVGPLRDIKYYSLYRLINEHDLYHCLSSYLPLFRIRTTTLITVHDLKYLKLTGLMRNKLKECYLKFILKRSLIKADNIIAISESTAMDIEDVIGCNKKTSVVYEANTLREGNYEGFEEQANQPKFFLCVGENRSHKNYARIIKAYNIAYRNRKGDFPDLYIAGNKVEELAELVHDLGLADKVVLLGLVPNEKILWLYRHAFVFLYVSLYEGFGLPLLESMSLGLPVITSDCHATKEISGGAAYLVDPTSIDNISRAMIEMCEDDTLRESYRLKGFSREKFFSWNKTAVETIRIYERLTQ